MKFLEAYYAIVKEVSTNGIIGVTEDGEKCIDI